MCVLYRSVLCLNLRLLSCWLHVLWLLDGCCQPVIRLRWTCFLLRLTMKILVMSAVSSLLGEDCGRDLPPCKHHVPLGSFGTRIFWNHPLTSPVPPPQQYSLYTWCNYKTSELVVALKLTPKTICTCNATGWFLPFFSLLTRYHLISNVDGVVETKQAKCPSNRLHGFLKMLNVQIISIFLRLSVCPQATPRGPGKTQLGTNLTMTKLSTTCV
jgi:hypothetical protein